MTVKQGAEHVGRCRTRVDSNTRAKGSEWSFFQALATLLTQQDWPVPPISIHTVLPAYGRSDL